MKHKDLQVFYKHQMPYGIRDDGGYLLFFAGIPKYANQEERYQQEIKEQFELADYLLACLKERK